MMSVHNCLRPTAADIIHSAIRHDAPVVQDEIYRYVCRYVDDPGLVRQVSVHAVDLMLTVPLNGTAFSLPPELIAVVTRATSAFTSCDDAQVSDVIHHAFLIAARSGHRRAKAMGSEPGILFSFVRALHALEQLIQQVAAGVTKDARTANEEADSFSTTACGSPSNHDIESAATPDLLRLSADGLPTRPGWMDDSDPVTPIVLRRNTDIPMPPMSELPQPSAVALSRNEAVIAVPSSSVDDALPDVLRLFPFSAAAVGLSVSPEQLIYSVGWCRRALTMRDSGVLSNAGEVILCADIADVLMAGADQLLVRTVAHQILTPIYAMGGYRRQILLETLGAWARNPDAGVPIIANTLQKHPQTVRYRLRQLRAVMADVMDDQQKVSCLRNAFLLNLV